MPERSSVSLLAGSQDFGQNTRHVKTYKKSAGSNFHSKSMPIDHLRLVLVKSVEKLQCLRVPSKK